MKLRLLSFVFIFSQLTHVHSVNNSSMLDICTWADAPILPVREVEVVKKVADLPVVDAAENVAAALDTVGQAAAGEQVSASYLASAWQVITNTLTWSYNTGNEYVGDMICDGLTFIQENYEANPVLTVAAGVAATAAAYVIVKKGLALASRLCSRRKAKQRVAADATPDDSAARKGGKPGKPGRGRKGTALDPLADVDSSSNKED